MNPEFRMSGSKLSGMLPQVGAPVRTVAVRNTASKLKVRISLTYALFACDAFSGCSCLNRRRSKNSTRHDHPAIHSHPTREADLGGGLSRQLHQHRLT